MYRLFAVLLIAFGVAVAAEPDVRAHDVAFLSIEEAWARETGPRALSAAVYMQIKNVGPVGDRLLSASSDKAEIVQIHQTISDGNVQRMSPVDVLPVASSETVSLVPGGHHIMLVRLTSPLTKGEQFPLRLTFERAGEMTVLVDVTGVEGRE